MNEMDGEEARDLHEPVQLSEAQELSGCTAEQRAALLTKTTKERLANTVAERAAGRAVPSHIAEPTRESRAESEPDNASGGGWIEGMFDAIFGSIFDSLMGSGSDDDDSS
ncbi:hypothetical protein [Ralstonia sp. UBA689]|uniref:hypothetical protein n=1 Tax=Ralstonia sp. UBA689 TaxID=1947373 RepID=UPI0025D91E00|nr:hypothetical protein [Ralstonia sp. UBA689]